jgi:DNA invertase Pin-like site-specific DNA recombinase
MGMKEAIWYRLRDCISARELAEMERELTVERTRAGLEVARLLGRKGGRKPKMADSKIEAAKKLLASGVPPKDVAKNLGVSIPTLYRWVPASAHA